MRKLSVLAAAGCLAAASLLSAGCLSSGISAGGSTPSHEETLDEKVDRIVSSMSITEKVGQMVMIGIHGQTVTDDSLYMLHQYHAGGVVLFDRNLASAEQVTALTEQLQAQADEKVPLFIGIDEEGGEVVRGRDFLTPPPSQREIGTAGEVTAAEAWAGKTAAALKQLGINVNFAPVADVGSPGQRSYGSDPEQVTKFVQAAAQGYEQHRELYALKHFPGIGRSVVDSHQEVSEIAESKEELLNSDLMPFRTMIDERQPEDYFILVSHLKYPAFDPVNPASQSRAIMTDLLRGELGFNGLIITDDMEMGAVAKHASYRQLGVNAVEAGADIVMICHEYEHETELYLGLLAAVKQGDISEDRINESVKRIVKAKLLHLN